MNLRSLAFSAAAPLLLLGTSAEAAFATFEVDVVVTSSGFTASGGDTVANPFGLTLPSTGSSGTITVSIETPGTDPFAPFEDAFYDILGTVTFAETGQNFNIFPFLGVGFSDLLTTGAFSSEDCREPDFCTPDNSWGGTGYSLVDDQNAFDYSFAEDLTGLTFGELEDLIIAGGLEPQGLTGFVSSFLSGLDGAPSGTVTISFEQADLQPVPLPPAIALLAPFAFAVLKRRQP